jgi:hypothetical protein
MKANPNLTGYSQTDIENLYRSGSITPVIDGYSNLVIQNVQNQLYSSSITLPLQNMVYNRTKVETKLDPNFYEL